MASPGEMLGGLGGPYIAPAEAPRTPTVSNHDRSYHLHHSIKAVDSRTCMTFVILSTSSQE